MIESIALRSFTISYFLTYPSWPLHVLVDKIAEHIQSRFFGGELVFIKEKELTGRIIQEEGEKYLVEVYDDNQSVPQKELISKEALLRKDSASKNEVLLFLLNSTRDTPLGRVVIGNAVSDLGLFRGQKPVAAEAPPVYKTEEVPIVGPARKDWAEVNNKKRVEIEELEEKREEAVRQEVLSVERVPWSIPEASFELNQIALSVYGMIITFSEFFKIEKISLDEFIKGVTGEKEGEKIISHVFSKLLKTISHERRKSGKDGLREIIQVAVEILYENQETESLLQCIQKEEKSESPGFTRIQWFAGDPNHKNWLVYMKSFIYDIVYAYEIPIKTREFAPETVKIENSIEKTIDRVLMLFFLLEICTLGIRFKQFFDNALEELKEKEKERLHLIHELKRVKGDFIIGDPQSKEKEELDRAEKNLAEFEEQYSPEVLRTKIGEYKSISFLKAGENLLYMEDKQIFLIPKEHWSELIEKFAKNKKKDVFIAETLRKYTRII
ncbi:hypothetical protein NEFER03_1221 [Nematocida sp. LUAm3]|nr:hypothetical protein NEFER03_1221 [Nematocida sp. LUAm3]KAI5175830.1 hypothetical protein NEFER02_1699 [Nematocida sp. LUAm2]KAI5178326.1 hypothetical protein NEFER01_1493 [Nematocida sp. LUAm1]